MSVFETHNLSDKSPIHGSAPLPAALPDAGSSTTSSAANCRAICPTAGLTRQGQDGCLYLLVLPILETNKADVCVCVLPGINVPMPAGNGS